jgi:hypothetical protein
VAVGPSTIEFDVDQTPPWWLSQNNAYVILHHGDQWSLRRVDFAGTESNSNEQRIFFKTDDDLSWPVGTKIYPALSSWIPDQVSGSLLTNTVQTVKMEFVCVPGLEAVEPPTAAPYTYDDRELWLKKPNWATPPQVTDYHPTTFIDFGYGRMDREVDVEHQGTRLVIAYTGRDFAESEELRDFFVRSAGQMHEFYMPTWQPDLTLARAPQTLDFELVVSGEEVATYYSTDPVRTGAGVAIIKKDGSILYLSVDSIFGEEDSNSQAVSVLALRSAVGEDIDLDDIDKVCWVPLWRHSTDSMSVQWLSSAVCQVSFTVQTQPWLPADIDDSNSDDSSNSEGV